MAERGKACLFDGGLFHFCPQVAGCFPGNVLTEEIHTMPQAARRQETPTILIVDDDRFMRVTMQDTLKEVGFLTVTAADGPSAIGQFTEIRPDALILDLLMPGMDGFTTCQELRKIPGGKFAPVLVITSMDDEESIHRAFEAGATDFIPKPINPRLLVYRLRYMLKASRSMKNLLKSEARLANAQRIAHLGNWEWDPATGAFRGSKETFRILEMQKPSRVCYLTHILAAIYPPDREMVDACLKKACSGNSKCSIDFCIACSDGTMRVVHLQGHADAALPGAVPRIVGTLQDVTDMRHVEDHLLMLKEAVECLPIGITLSNTEGKIIYSNPAEAEIHGYAAHELVDRNARGFAPARLRQPFTPEQDSIWCWKRESINIRKNGKEFPVQLISTAVKDSRGRCLGTVTACEDISKRKEVEERLHQLAFNDALTGLPNRGTFLDRLHHALSLAHREERQVGLLFLDLDNFKDINDTQGHDFGDKLLKEVAGRLAACMRDCDTLARLGGDEFVVILASIAGPESAAAAARRILAIFSQPFDIEGRKVFSSVSIGIALYPDDGPDAEVLYKCADTAMYHAKTERKGNFRFFSPEMNHHLLRRVALESSLRQGLEKQEFFLHYQPQWDVKTANMIGVEALVRWQSADFGLLPPSEFIALAENSGVIFGLGEWVLHTAFVQAREWAFAGHRNLRVAVNISGQQFKHPDFLATMERNIRDTGVKPETLELEFTESVVMENADRTITTLQSLKDLGIRLSIDDFGTGYSSLSYLKHFPIDRIKIDRSFVADVNRSKDDAAIVEAIISMAHSLKLKVVAEGVEDGDQLHFLKARGCDEVQGYYLAKPMSAEELAPALDGVLKKRAYRHSEQGPFDYPPISAE